MDIRQEYELWCQQTTLKNEDEDLITELLEIAKNDDEIYDRFYCELTFGTAGLRGVIGAGTNRMNIYTVRRATKGLAVYLNERYDSPSVAISFDSRIKSELFARESARVLAGNGIRVHISKELQPTPVLSYAVRELKCSAGIMITASHNPAKYNGYKCYGEDGCQITEIAAGKILDLIGKEDLFEIQGVSDFEAGVKSGMISYIDDSLYESYLKRVLGQSIHPGVCKGSGLRVVFTPLNGAGNKPVRKILELAGSEDIHVVPQQEHPDGNFPTCGYPNPEFKEALNLAIELGLQVKSDLVIATDPDSDRVGIAVRQGNNFRLMTGNEVGILLANYILSGRAENKTLPVDPVIIRTVVSSTLVDKIAKDYGAQVVSVLTGFKYIGEHILNLENKGQEDRFVFGFEESYGYLAGSYVRDKDAVVASMLIYEMAVFYCDNGMTLVDVLEELYKKYGLHVNTTLNYTFDGASGMSKMYQIMGHLREKPHTQIAGYRVEGIADYMASRHKNTVTGEVSEIKLPKSNMLCYNLSGGNSIIIRPSGTEPKIKAYITVVSDSREHCDKLTKNFSREVTEMMGL